MKASELRLGNCVFDAFGDIFQIDFIGICNVDKLKLQPIPLTEEWLLKFGFEKIENNWKVLDLYFGIISWERLAGTMFCLEKESIFLPHIKYVHQLQNLYFALTGEELTITKQ